MKQETITATGVTITVVSRDPSGSCGCVGGFGRRFLTKEEKIAELQEYLESLKKEAQAVEERIAGLKGD